MCSKKFSSLVVSRPFEVFLAVAAHRSYTMAGKNKHDDVPDGMAMFAIFAQDLSGGTIKVVNRRF